VDGRADEGQKQGMRREKRRGRKGRKGEEGLDSVPNAKIPVGANGFSTKTVKYCYILANSDHYIIISITIHMYYTRC